MSAHLRLVASESQSSRDDTDCFMIVACICGLYGRISAKEITQPGDGEARKLAVVVASGVGIPRTFVCSYFNASEQEVLLWELELSACIGAEPRFWSVFHHALAYCRNVTAHRQHYARKEM